MHSDRESSVSDQEAYDYYADPANQVPAGPPVRRKRPRLTGMTSIRFDPAVIKAATALAHEEGMTVSSWIRKLVQRETEPPRMVEVACDGLDEPLLIPESALAAITTAALPAIVRHGSVSLRIGTPRPQARVERPADLIEGSGRRGQPKALPSSLQLKRRSFACPHLSVGNVTAVICEACGPLEGAA